MKKLYCFVYGMYRKFKKPKISYFLEKTLALLFIITCSKYKNEDEKSFKEEESIKILKAFGFIEHI